MVLGYNNTNSRYNSIMDSLLLALQMTLGVDTFISVVIGVLVGLFFGSIPGLTYSVALILVLPATFTMEPVPGIALLLATYVGGMTGGSVGKGKIAGKTD